MTLLRKNKWAGLCLLVSAALTVAAQERRSASPEQEKHQATLTRSARKPNIVLMLMDDLGYGELGIYGGGILRGAPTPRIDKLPSSRLSALPHVPHSSIRTRDVLLTVDRGLKD